MAGIGANPLPSGAILDISRVSETRGIHLGPDALRVGASVHWSELARYSFPGSLAALAQAAEAFGTPQIRNRATIGGNLCTASPVADGAAVLLALQAEVHLVSWRGTRIVPLSRFLLGVRRIDRLADEIMAAVHIPVPATTSGSVFLKHGGRRASIISTASVAAVLEWGQDSRIRAARLVVGALSPVPRRCPATEGDLIGHPLSADFGPLLNRADFDALSPLTDIRDTAEHRRVLAGVLASRALTLAAQDNRRG